MALSSCVTVRLMITVSLEEENMESPKKQPRMTVEEYLLFEESQEVRHEYVNGRIFQMTGGTAAHNLISLNIAASLKMQLKDSGCRAYIADMKVRVEASNSFYYPDVIVDCGSFDRSSVFTSSPIFIFEVLSRSTASTDRREKLLEYQQIPGLKAYLIVHQSRKRVDVYRRESDVDWAEQELGAGDDFELSCKNRTIKIKVDDIYEDTDMESSPDLHVRENAEVYLY